MPQQLGLSQLEGDNKTALVAAVVALVVDIMKIVESCNNRPGCRKGSIAESSFLDILL